MSIHPWSRRSVRRNRSLRALALAGPAALALAMLLAPAMAEANDATGSTFPSVRVIAPAASVQVGRIPGQPIDADPGVLIASHGGPWQVDIRRPNYGPRVVATQIGLPGPGADVTTATRPLPANLVKSLSGLDGFFHVSVRDARGHLVSVQHLPFCPSGVDQRTDNSGPLNPTYPRNCYLNPFSIGVVMGIDRGWATSALGYAGVSFSGRNGTYSLRLAISKRYRHFFGVRTSDGVARVALVVGNVGGCGAICPRAVPSAPSRTSARSSSRTVLTPAPAVTPPSSTTMPDLVALPAWNVTIDRVGTREYLDFAASVWDRGPAPLLVEGFRTQGQAMMQAWQYFTDADGHITGRLPVGELNYDARPGHQHWHFEQFARYSLLDADHHQVVLSEKEGFCLAPTDPIDMTVPRADWTPSQTGLATACGSAASIWVREVLPSGWGDTYLQTLPGQSFDITDLPNGTYYISIQANPSGILYERTRANDVQLRRITIDGSPGHRSVTAAPWHGIRS